MITLLSFWGFAIGRHNMAAFTAPLTFISAFEIYESTNSNSTNQDFKCELYSFPNGSHASYLSADVSIDCDGDEWELYSKYAAVMIVIYPVGIPLLYYVMIYQHRRILSDEALVVAERGNGSPNIGHLDFLVAPYKAEHYNFDVPETVRRLMLAGIVGVVSPSAMAAPVLGMVISAFFAWAFTNYRPYRNGGDNDLSVLLSFGLQLLFLAALLIKVDATSDDEHDQDVLGALLIVVLFSGPLMLALRLARDLVRAINDRVCPAKSDDDDTRSQQDAAGGQEEQKDGDSSSDDDDTAIVPLSGTPAVTQTSTRLPGALKGVQPRSSSGNGTSL